MISLPRSIASLGRGVRMLVSPRRLLLVQLAVTRRCNLACGYCCESDDHSSPVAAEILERRIDHAASLGTLILTLTGGKPLLHPRLEALVARMASRGMVTTLIANGWARCAIGCARRASAFDEWRSQPGV